VTGCVADSNDGGDTNAEVVVATLTYDGLNRRIKKLVSSSADWNGTFPTTTPRLRSVQAGGG